MTDKEIIEAVAKLDGSCISECPNYLTSRDAIVPVIEKRIRNGGYNREELIWSFEYVFGSPCTWQDVLCATPRQLCEALLRATGKWKD